MPAGISAHKKDRSADRSFLHGHTAGFARTPSHSRRRGLSSTPSRPRSTDCLGRPYKMVRGLCQRDWIRGVVDVTRCAVSNAGAIGHAKRLQQTHPGNPANAGRRGRRPLRAVCILHVAAYNVRAQPAHHFVRASEVIRQPRPGGRGRPPLRRVGKASASLPRWHQPLSHGAARRDSSPFRGAERAVS